MSTDEHRLRVDGKGDWITLQVPASAVCCECGRSLVRDGALDVVKVDEFWLHRDCLTFRALQSPETRARWTAHVEAAARRAHMEELIEHSSLGTPAAKALRASVSDDLVAQVMRRLKNGEGE